MTFFDTWCQTFTSLLRKDFGLSDLDCAAILGNAGEESGGFKSLQEKKPLVPGSKGGYGIMQWTGPRRRDFEAYCQRNNLNPAEMMSNYKFLFVELSGPEGKALEKIKAVDTLEKKTEVFMATFLRPGIPHLDLRISWAKKALKAIQAMNVPVKAPTKPIESVPVKEAPVQQSLFSLLLAALLALFKRS